MTARQDATQAIREIEQQMRGDYKAAQQTTLVDHQGLRQAVLAGDKDTYATIVAQVEPGQLCSAACEHSRWLHDIEGVLLTPDAVHTQFSRALAHQNPAPEPAAGLPTADEISEIAATEARLLERQIADETDDADRALLQRERNALNKAAHYYASGQVRESGGDLLVPSATDNTVYRVARHGGVFTCGCKAHEKGQPCWHVALAQLIDQARAARDAGYGDDAPDAEPTRAEVDPALQRVFAAWRANQETDEEIAARYAQEDDEHEVEAFQFVA
jgi:hypothetical protein